MNRYILVLFTFISALGLNAQLPPQFQQLLDSAQMIYVRPERLLPPRSIDTGGIAVDYTVKFPGRNFEIRYHIVPSSSPEMAEIGTNFDIWHTAIGRLISGFAPNDHYIVDPIPPKELKNFNAENGVVCLVRLKPDFSRNYKYCQIKIVYRANAGLALVYYFTDTTNNFELFTKQELKSLMFK